MGEEQHRRIPIILYACTVDCRTLKVWLKPGCTCTFGDVDVDGCYAAIYDPNNENETADNLHHSKPLWFNNPYTTFISSEMVDGMHIECHYVGANLLIHLHSHYSNQPYISDRFSKSIDGSRLSN